jgi:parvulin-like peptidyl-prolyl isomerase
LCRRDERVTIGGVSSRRRLASASIALLVICACDRFASDPGARVVATVGTQSVTAAQLQAYLDANQFTDPAAEPPSPGDLARVKSRLFDDFLDGELLLQEARRRGVTVTDPELAEYLGKDVPIADGLRELARRDLMIQKLREAAVLDGVHVDEKEIDAWLAAQKPAAEPALPGTLRTLRLASYPEAARVRSEIVAKKLSFAEAEVAYGTDSLPDAPRVEDLEALPAPIAAAAKALTPGSISQPLPFESSVLLFILEPADDGTAQQSRKREIARRAIALDKSQAVSDKLLADLRAKTVVTRHVKELPFAYVAEDAVPHAK